MSKVSVYLVCESETGNGPVALARTFDPEAVRTAAEAAIEEAESKAVTHAGDAALGLLHREDVSHLRRSLELLIPQLRVAQQVM